MNRSLLVILRPGGLTTNMLALALEGTDYSPTFSAPGALSQAYLRGFDAILVDDSAAADARQLEELLGPEGSKKKVVYLTRHLLDSWLCLQKPFTPAELRALLEKTADG